MPSGQIRPFLRSDQSLPRYRSSAGARRRQDYVRISKMRRQDPPRDAGFRAPKRSPLEGTRRSICPEHFPRCRQSDILKLFRVPEGMRPGVLGDVRPKQWLPTARRVRVLAIPSVDKPENGTLRTPTYRPGGLTHPQARSKGSAAQRHPGRDPNPPMKCPRLGLVGSPEVSVGGCASDSSTPGVVHPAGVANEPRVPAGGTLPRDRSARE